MQSFEILSRLFLFLNTISILLPSYSRDVLYKESCDIFIYYSRFTFPNCNALKIFVKDLHSPISSSSHAIQTELIILFDL